MQGIFHRGEAYLTGARRPYDGLARRQLGGFTSLWLACQPVVWLV